jgi:hypothetical protein
MTQREHMMVGNSFPWGLLALVDGFPARSQHILKGRKTDRRHRAAIERQHGAGTSTYRSAIRPLQCIEWTLPHVSRRLRDISEA